VEAIKVGEPIKTTAKGSDDEDDDFAELQV
jgi:hypothetical protein